MEIAIAGVLALCILMFFVLADQIRRIKADILSSQITETKDYEGMKSQLGLVDSDIKLLKRELGALQDKYDETAMVLKAAEEEAVKSEKMFQEGLQSILNYSSQNRSE